MTTKSASQLSPQRVWLLAGSVALTVVLIDQLAKLWAVANLEGRSPIVVLGSLFGENIGPVFQLRVIRNAGAAFGLGAFGPASTLVLSVIAIVVVVVLIRFVTRIKDPWWALALGLVLGGALGNLIDRLTREPDFLRGRVVDFFELPNFPIFNVADLSLTCAVIIILILTIKGRSWG